MSTTWRYCISRESSPEGDQFTVRELYTDEDGALSWSSDPVAAHGETWVECANDLARMTGAMNAPILDLTLDPPALVCVRDLPRGSRFGRLL